MGIVGAPGCQAPQRPGDLQQSLIFCKTVNKINPDSKKNNCIFYYHRGHHSWPDFQVTAMAFSFEIMDILWFIFKYFSVH